VNLMCKVILCAKSSYVQSHLMCKVILCAKSSYAGENRKQSKQLIPPYWIILAYQDINQGSLVKYKCKINSKNVE